MRARHRGVVLLAGAAAVVAGWSAAALTGWQIAAGCALGWLLLAAAAIDGQRRILPDRLTLPLVPAGWLWASLAGQPLAERLTGAAAGWAAFAALAMLYRRMRRRDGLGLGDAKLLAAAGAWVGWPGLPSVVALSALAALGWALLLRLGGRPLQADTALPFGPFLAAGFWLVWLYGPLAVG